MKAHCEDCKVMVINGHPTHESGCFGTFSLMERGKPHLLVQAWSLDAWGNPREGFEINDRSQYGRPFFIQDDEGKLLKKLKRKHMISKYAKNKSLQIDWQSRDIYVNAKNGEPIYQLEVL